MSVDFNSMSASLERPKLYLKVARLSTPSYAEAARDRPLSFYTQWLWFRKERNDTYTPFYPGTLQYTLEEKYLKPQYKYYFEFEHLRLLVKTQGSPMIQRNLDTQHSTRIIRRPLLVLADKTKRPKISPLLLHSVPAQSVNKVPDYWSTVDRFQDFELVELESTETEYVDVQSQFFSSMDSRKHEIEHIFRVQNPGLWDKYCSARRAMTPRGQTPDDVKERRLFHGTPTIQSARGICANSFDFRRAGENVGAIYGKGAYFSTTAHYSHAYTRVDITGRRDPVRFMFLGRILVGQHILGRPSYTKPPERDELKLYDSCVDDMNTPTIFVIFDLAQSYPEYLIHYVDVSDIVDAPITPSQPPPAPPRLSRSQNKKSSFTLTAMAMGHAPNSSSSCRNTKAQPGAFPHRSRSATPARSQKQAFQATVAATATTHGSSSGSYGSSTSPSAARHQTQSAARLEYYSPATPTDRSRLDQMSAKQSFMPRARANKATESNALSHRRRSPGPVSRQYQRSLFTLFPSGDRSSEDDSSTSSDEHSATSRYGSRVLARAQTRGQLSASSRAHSASRRFFALDDP